MSIEDRQTKTVYAVIEELVEQGAATFRPGDVASALRERGQPLGAWEIRGEFSVLEADGLISVDAKSGEWSIKKAASRKAAGKS